MLKFVFLFKLPIMPTLPFTELISEYVWHTKYQFNENGHAHEPDLQASWKRVALALSAAEPHDRNDWRDHFEAALAHFRFLPGGRILANAGTNYRKTLLNCFVAGELHDSIDSIFSGLSETMLTMQAGGGVGCDFSCIRPAGFPVQGGAQRASGPVSFMRVWNFSCATLQSGTGRRGAMMACLRIDHPDIESFIDAKKDASELRNFNLSVLVTDAFMHAVEHDLEWMLVFPLEGRAAPQGAMVLDRLWSHSIEPTPCAVIRSLPARSLWEKLQRAAFEVGDPGVLFIDRIEQTNNLSYEEIISATNPCGEVPLPSHGACNLGSINLTQFIHNPFGPHPRLDLQAIAGTTAVATRLLDNAISLTYYPLKVQEKQSRSSCRIGIGITGLADAFIMLGLRYGSDASLELAETLMRTICHAAYRTSVDLVHERGVFPSYRAKLFESSAFIKRLPAELHDAVHLHGIHNSHLTAIAPAGSISLLANNISSGIEPVFAFSGDRFIKDGQGKTIVMPTQDYAWKLFQSQNNAHFSKLPSYFVQAAEVDWREQLKLQAVLQTHVDQAISKTINIPEVASFDQYRDVFDEAYKIGLKGCTVFRSSGNRAGVITHHEVAA
jgi:ribonucleoside-diphosphate reductase alpha chain